MGFYGHIIKDPGQTQFYFDRKYSNLAELKRHETTDGIYAGRYVLVEYSEDFKFKGIALQNSNIIKEDDGSLYGKADGLLEGDFVSITIDKNTAVYKCISFTNKGIAVFDTTPAIQGEKINYYDFNYNVDRVYLQESFGRGYDSTVWQKVYLDDDIHKEKYVMIAELNSVTPTFRVFTNKPSEISKGVYFDADTSTNLTYNMYVPNAWDFTATTPAYNKDGFKPEKTSKINKVDTFTVETKNNDTKNLVIDIPSIGNTISDLWDNVYGKSEGNNNRPLYPVEWANGMTDTTKIYSKDGKLWRFVPTENKLVELPLDNSEGSLKALQLQMHQWLGTNENVALADDSATLPGAIRKAKEDVADLLGYANDGQGFKTVHGTIDTLTNTNLTINREWTGLKGNNSAPNKDIETIYGALNVIESKINEAENATSNVNTVILAANTATMNADSATERANLAAVNANAVKEEAIAATNRANIAATNAENITTQAHNLIGDETDTEMTTMHGVINKVNQVVSDKFSANSVIETEDNVFISQAQKDSLFNGDNRLFYQKTETYNKNEVDTKIADLIGSAPETLNTLEELAAALGDNADIIDTLNGVVGTKQDKITGAATTIISDNLTGSKVLVSDGSGKVATSEISNTELSYLQGVNSGIQDQINNIKYAGSSEKGGAANSANKLNTNAGSKTQPVYFENGIPYETTYTLSESVPSGAKFTDTVYTHPTSSGNKHIPKGGSSGQILRWSADGTAVWGNDNNTTYSAATQSSAGLMSAKDKTKLDRLNFSSGTDLPSTLADGEIFFLIKNN